MEEEKIAFVTGAGKGIGRGIALSLSKKGFIVVGNGRSFDPKNLENGLFEVKKTIELSGGIFFPIQGDVSLAEDRDRMVDAIYNEYGKIDILVNNAGVAPLKRLDMLETTEESYDRVMDINLKGPFFLTQAIANKMIEHKKENPKMKPIIIFVTSISVYYSSPSRAEYCISKAGLSNVSTLYAHRLAEHGINVYEIRPGITATDMTTGVKEKYDKLIAEGLVPQNRWGTPEDIGRSVAALAIGDFPYSTGTIIEASGGMQIQRL
ncbi:MAG: 3-ketoacyl-ACP reductase [Melioribacteraceae bacterium]|nr:3-ketoacyl-ACP reductase [Melioribacteraceae bacterium]